jgi:hypothetical protein
MRFGDGRRKRGRDPMEYPIYTLFRYVPTFDFDATINLNKEKNSFIKIKTY